MATVETPKFTVQDGYWNIKIKHDNGSEEILRGMPDGTIAYKNYEILKKILQNVR